MRKEEVYFDRAIKLFNKGLFHEAKQLVTGLLATNNNDTDLLNLLAGIEVELGNTKNAKEIYSKAINIDNTKSKLYGNLALIYIKEHNYKKAIDILLKAIKTNPKDADAYMSLGVCLQEEKLYNKAEESYKNSIALGNKSTSVYFDLAKLYMQTDSFTKAKEMFEKALEQSPNNSDILFEYSILFLKLKQYKRGFDLYRNRYAIDKSDKQTHILSRDKLLQKGYHIRGKKILMTDEQGFGDIIQFARYLPIFAKMEVTVSMYIRPLLEELLKDNFPFVNFITSNKRVEYNYHLPLMDSAYYFDTEYETIPSQYGYLGVNQQNSRKIEKKYFFDQETKKRIGIIWRTNSPKGESLKKQQERLSRNVDLNLFLKYFQHENMQLYSLQVNISKEERTLLKKYNIPSLGDNLVSFYDNALIIDNLDLIVAIDTVSTIIAGAMGKKAKILLSENADWRWTPKDNVSNWFKSIDIYRKSNIKSWDDIFKEIIQEKDIFSAVSNIERLLNKANTYLDLGRLQDALEICNEVLTADQNNYTALRLIGLVMYEAGDIKKSIEFLSLASKINPGDKELRDDLARIVSELKLTQFEKEYLYFKPYNFDIARFNLKDKKFILSNKAKKLLQKLKKEVNNIRHDTLLYDILNLYISILEKDFFAGIKRFLSYNTETNPEIFLEKLNILYILENDLSGFNFSKNEMDIIISSFVNIFTDSNTTTVFKLLFMKLCYDFYLVKRYSSFKTLLPYFENILKQALRDKTELNHLLFLYECITFMYWGTGYNEKSAINCDKNIIKPFSKYILKYFQKSGIRPITKPYKHTQKRICFIASKLVFGSYSVGKILYSLIFALAQENLQDYKIYCYILDDYDKTCTEKLQQQGIQVATFKDDTKTSAEKAKQIREKAIKDEIDIAIFDMPWSIQTYLIESRIAPKQYYWSHGWSKYSLKNIDKKICHYQIEKNGWKVFSVPLLKEFLIGSQEEKLLAKELKRKILEQYGKNTVALGTIGRLIKIESEEYIKTLSKILKQNPNTIYIACGNGDKKNIKKLMTKYNIDLQKVIFAGEVNPHVYGWVIDVWLDSFPLGHGQSKDEYIAKKRPVIFHTKRQMKKNDINSLFVAKDDKEYVYLVNNILNNPVMQKEIADTEFNLWFNHKKNNFLKTVP